MKSMRATILFALLSVWCVQTISGDESDEDTSIVDAEEDVFPEFEGTFDCRDTEVFSKCDANPSCQRTCDTVDKPALPCPKRSCIAGCICRDSFVRSELYGGCIPEDQCGRVQH